METHVRVYQAKVKCNNRSRQGSLGWRYVGTLSSVAATGRSSGSGGTGREAGGSSSPDGSGDSASYLKLLRWVVGVKRRGCSW